MPDTGPTGSLLPAGLWQNWPPRFLFFSYAAIILTEYHLQHPMQAIFNLPVIADITHPVITIGDATNDAMQNRRIV